MGKGSRSVRRSPRSIFPPSLQQDSSVGDGLGVSVACSVGLGEGVEVGEGVVDIEGEDVGVSVLLGVGVFEGTAGSRLVAESTPGELQAALTITRINNKRNVQNRFKIPPKITLNQGSLTYPNNLS
jgi:hypothetical protein